MPVSVDRLQNGITVYISPNHLEPRVVAYVAVRAGSRHDPADSTGLAHYLEHMLFKGTDEFGTLDIEAERPHLDAIAELYAELRGAEPSRRAALLAKIDAHNQALAATAIPNELDRMYASLGVEGVNAYTSDEVTAYTAEVPANRLEAWARIEAERFADPVFRLFYTELEAVFEEKNLSLDDPEEQAWEALLGALFPAHPYGTQTTIGATEDLEDPAYADMVAYFERWYAPANMAVILAGDVEREEALAVLERTLGQIPPRPVAGQLPPGALPPVAGRVEREVFGEGEQSVTVAWQTVAATDPDEPIVVVLDWLMDNSQSGLLNVELGLSQKVQEVYSWSTTLNEAGYFAIEATLLPGQTHAEAEALILDVVAKLQAGAFSPADVDAIKLHEDIALALELEDNWARVERMLDAFITKRAWSEVVARQRRLDAVTREDVIRVANERLGDDYVVVNRRAGKPKLPEISKPQITPITIDSERHSDFARDIAGLEFEALEPKWLVAGRDYSWVELPAGRLLVTPNPRNELFTLDYRFDRGHRKAALLCVALELLERSGAGQRSAEALQKQLFALGTTVRFDCGAETSGIEIAGIDAKLEPSVALVEAWLRDPSFDDETLAKLREAIIGRRRDALDDPDAVAELLADYARYGARSPALSAPSNAAIREADAASLRELIQTLPDHRHRTLYFGPRSADEIAALVGLGRRHRETGPRRALRYRDELGPGTTTIYLLDKDVAKSTISVTLTAAPQPRALRPVADYLSHYLDGSMGSLMFQEIREARGLAYYASASVWPGTKPGDDWALRGAMGTQVDKTAEALLLYLELVRGRPIEAPRLAEARASLDANFRAARIDPRAVRWWVDSWERLGEPEDPRPWSWAQIQATELAEVEALAEQLGDGAVSVSVVGDRERIDLDALAALGTLVEVEAEQLVSYGPF